MITDIGQDFHYAIRRLRLNVGFSIVAVLMLALGIGANAAVYSLMDQVLLRPFSGIIDTERLVQIGGEKAKQKSGDFDTISYPDYLDYRRTSHGFESLAAFQNVRVDLTTATGTEEANADVSTTNYFDTVGIKAQLGNVFEQVDEQPGQSNSAPVAVISDGTWKRRFNRDANIIGATIRINKFPFVIIGIAPPGFQGTELRRPADVWVPITAAQTVLPEFRDHLTSDRGFRWLQCIARLRPGVSVAQAQAEVDTIAGNLGIAYPQDDAGKGLKLDPHLGLLPSYRHNAMKLTALLQGGAGLLLLITCSNLATLQLASAAKRHREMAIRSALGATTGRMIRQLIMESTLLSALGVIATVPVIFWAGRVLSVPLLGEAFPSHLHIELNKSVLIFTIGLAFVTVLFFGLMPAWSASTMRSPTGLKGVTSSSGLSQSATRKVLVICQVALSFVLLIGATLLVKTLFELQHADPGFRTQGILKASIDLGREGYDVSRGREFYHQFLTKVQSLPGVISGCLTTTPPADRNQSTNIAVGIEGRPVVPHQPGVQVRLAAVTPEYFRTLGLSLIKGRGFSDRDNDEAPLVAIVNESLAKQFWESEDVVGKHFHLVTTKGAIEVIGVLKNSTIVRLDEQGSQPFLYVPFDQFPKSNVTLLVQSRVNPMNLLSAVTRELALLDPDVPLSRPETLRQHLDESLGRQRFMATLIAGFAVLALILAELGLYAVISQSVNARIREMGIRMALGSSKAQLIWLVVKQGMLLAIIGLAVGFIAVCALAPYLKTFLFRVQSTDTATFAGVSLCLLVVALVASYLPSRRAAQVDPILALRNE